MNDPRLVIERLCAERGEDFAGLSRMLGRNAAYIQQYVRRGIPKRLGEDERRKLARYFGISESLLGGPASETAENGLMTVDRHPVMVSAGPGAIVTEELGKPYFAFDQLGSVGERDAAVDEGAVHGVGFSGSVFPDCGRSSSTGC